MTRISDLHDKERDKAPSARKIDSRSNSTAKGGFIHHDEINPEKTIEELK
jgi:hypothetical protein